MLEFCIPSSQCATGIHITHSVHANEIYTSLNFYHFAFIILYVARALLICGRILVSLIFFYEKGGLIIAYITTVSVLHCVE